MRKLEVQHGESGPRVATQVSEERTRLLPLPSGFSLGPPRTNPPHEPRFSRQGVAEFLAAVREHVACLEQVRDLALAEYKVSCREKLTVRKTVRKNFLKLELVLRPGRPRKDLWQAVQRFEADLRQVVRGLGEEEIAG